MSIDLETLRIQAGLSRPQVLGILSILNHHGILNLQLEVYHCEVAPPYYVELRPFSTGFPATCKRCGLPGDQLAYNFRVSAIGEERDIAY